MIRPNQTKTNPEEQVKILSIVTLLVTFALLGWVIFSFYNFYLAWSKKPQSQVSESYIDKQGLKAVKLKLEERK